MPSPAARTPATRVPTIIVQGGPILIDWRGRAGYATSTRLMPIAIMAPTLDKPRVPL